MSGPTDIGVLVGMLADRIGALAAELAPDGVRRGPEWVARNPTRADGKIGSFSVCVAGPRAGVWADFAEGGRAGGAAGDALDLVAYCRCGGDKKAAVRWARSWLGLDGADPAAFEQARAQAESRTKARQAAATAERKKANDRAWSLWLSARAELAGTPADAYLKGRGIDLALLGRQPRALRFAPDCYNGHLGRRFPAMVAMIQGPDGKTMGVHRTFLIEHAGGWTHIGKVLLAEDGKPVRGKLVYGDKKGGLIPLWRGVSGQPLARAPMGDHVTITEGIEDGLVAALARPERRVAVAIDVENFGALRLPAAITDVTLAVDNDGANAATARAVDAAIAAYQRQGRRVWLARAPIGKDFNDTLTGAA